MSIVRSRRLFGPRYCGTTLSLCYTVPTGRTLIVRLLRAWDRNGAGANFGWRIVASGIPAENWDPARALPVSGTRDLTLPLILNPGDELWSVTNDFTVMVSGFGSLLNGAPS